MTTDKNNAAPDPQPAELAEQQGQVIVHALADAYAAGAEGLQFGGLARMEALAAALAATGKQQVGEEVSVEEDVYCSIADMIEPYVQREGTNPDGPLPASVHDSVKIIFDHWLKTRAPVGEVQGDAVEHAKNLDLLRAGYHVDAEPRAAALNAAIAALAARQPGAQDPITVEAVATVRRSGEGDRYIYWLTEGGIADLEAGDVLMVSDRAITNHDGSGEVYAAPPAQGIDLGVTEEEREWIDYAIAHMRDDSEPEDLTCADALEQLLRRIDGQRDAAPGVGNG